jgi:hypothetical protein
MKIDTDIFYKATDSKTYLPFNSCHPKHTKISIPFSLARRLRTIISDEKTFQKRTDELLGYLNKQNYPKSLIQAGIDRAKSLDRKQLLTEERSVNNKETIAYVSTFNPRNPELFSEIIHDINILKRDPHMRNVLENYQIIKSKRQPPNLKRILTKAKYTETTSNPKVSRCLRPNCGLCTYLIEGEAINTRQGQTITTKTDMSCDVKNVIYIIICKGCKGEYIGETNELRKRITVHRQQIRNPLTRMLKVSEHIDNCTQTEPKFSVFPFYKMQTDSVLKRRQMEQHFITLFKPNLN